MIAMAFALGGVTLAVSAVLAAIYRAARPGLATRPRPTGSVTAGPVM